MWKYGICLLLFFQIVKSKYVLRVVKIDECPDFTSEIDGVSLITNLHDSAFDANFSVPFVIDDHVFIKLVINPKDKDDSNETVLEINHLGFCNTMHVDFETIWKRASELMKIPPTCPYPAGNYNFAGLTATDNELDMEFYEAGAYVGKVFFVRDDKKAACRRVEIAIAEE